MTKGRKPVDRSVKMRGNLPVDRAFYRDCQNYLLMGSDPDPQFVRELLTRYVRNCPPRDMTGPEIAAMVDHWAIQTTSIAKAIQFAHSFFYGHYSIDAITQHHKRYGKNATQLGRERTRRNEELGDIIVTDGDIKVARRRLQARERKYALYEKLKKDLFG